ncbi:hypothetical protein [Paenibacillus abyssi]|uniref:Uncharacterized protein n=1 Tax=Paenibacillus abyssi TaxID=1340531 RepID=A0A917G1Y0_9BACL|nr:hypothetical protein [Paenibacillus abyssi]GGG18748.1 hypothetical protein GCM10010916_39420 [Paenibacillus abyssi]
MNAEQFSRDRLEGEFEDDPLFETIQRMGLTDELFDDETISRLIDGHEYTTTDFEKWYCLDEASPQYLANGGVMRAFIKSMMAYLQTRSVGRSIIMDYQGFIKLKMALLLRKNGMKPALIYETAGTKAYSPVILSPGQRAGGQSASPAVPNAKEKIYGEVMDSLISQLQAAGAIVQQDGKFQVDLRKLIEGHMEGMLPSLLPDPSKDTEERLAQHSEELNNLKEEIAGVTEFKRSYDKEMMSLKELQQRETECRGKLKEIYNSIMAPETSSTEKEKLSMQLRDLEVEYPDQDHLIRMYADSADAHITRIKQDEKELRIQDLKRRCMDLYNTAIDKTIPPDHAEEARRKLQKLHDDNPELSFEMRAYIASLPSDEKTKSRGLFWWLKKTPKH